MKLHYEFHKEAGKPAAVFLHGFMGNLRDWDETAGRLAGTCRCLAIDLPGHGQSRVAPDASFPDMAQTADLVVETLDDACAGRVVLVGYSMGGRVALHTALRHPERVSHLVLESASPGIAEEKERAQRRESDEALARDLEGGDFETFLRRWYGMPLFDSLREDPARLETVIARRREGDQRELANSLRAIGTGRQESLWDALPEVTVPTLAVVGERDEKFRAIGEAMAGRAPDLQVRVMPGCGHNVHEENPDAFCDAVRPFVGAK